MEPKVFSFFGTTLQRATKAVTPCGLVTAGDLVWLRCDTSGCVASIIAFWSQHGCEPINAQVEKFIGVDGRGDRWSKGAPVQIFVDTDDIVSAVMHADLGGEVVLVIRPISTYL